ncbi:MAG: hypothetical protein KDD69_09840 [Bdellovibrionales bacterium]|nr:hypothetical protein [Bdellovibrionales bacterium]
MAHPIAYLITAAGVSGLAYSEELGATSYLLIFPIQLWAVVCGTTDRIGTYPRSLLILALVVPGITLLPALA